MEKQRISLIGVGTGTQAGLTVEAQQEISACDAAIGAPRMLELCENSSCATYSAILAADMMQVIHEHPEHHRICVLFSGDTGFYSGAKQLRALLLEKENNYDLVELPGISALVYFCAKRHVSWDTVHLVSCHGRQANPVGEVQSHARTFLLTGSPSAREICTQLTNAGFGNLFVWAGEMLSYPQESIVHGTVEAFAQREFQPLTVLLIENPNPLGPHYGGIPDEEFLRGKVPMTKAEVRAVSLAKLGVQPQDVVYDIGAGTGAVTVELAYAAYKGTVYAVEKNPNAQELILQNKEKFGCSNIHLVCGEAPAVLKSLPAPDCAFIGGSSGTIRTLLNLLLQKNPQIRVVVPAITLETLVQTAVCMEELNMQNVDMVQTAVTKINRVGSYHMLQAQNPVYILSAQGGKL